MIRHVVLWEMHDPADAQRFGELLRTCARLVPGMRGFEVATRADSVAATADVCLVASFSDAEALRAYEAHPQHRQVSERLRPLRRARHVFDYLVAEG
ncbi:MAG TPA: Dabb family protein [Albitalea sp.]|nr:Dabb family protein [Albitalea sp.]